VNSSVPGRIALKSRFGHIGFSALTTVVIAALPKCPLCWMALMSALGVGSTVNTAWLQPLAAGLLFLLLGVLLARAHRRRSYGALCLGLGAGVALYLSKFRLNNEVGVYLSGAALVGASIWNARLPRRATGNTQCHCHLNL
jgi:hypothetical protein